jgi:hypothetical protein
MGKMPDMICPCLTYLDMQQAMAELGDVFGLEIVWLGDDAAEIRWNGGLPWPRPTSPRCLTAGTPAMAGPTCEFLTPTPTTPKPSAEALTFSTNQPHSTPDGQQRGYSARDREGNIWTFAIHEFGR